MPHVSTITPLVSVLSQGHFQIGACFSPSVHESCPLFSVVLLPGAVNAASYPVKWTQRYDSSLLYP